MLHELLSRNLPPVFLPGTTKETWPLRRRELLELFSRWEYGFSPPPPDHVRAETVSENLDAWAGKAVHREVQLSFPTPRGEFSFPVDTVLPSAGGKVPVFVHISFKKYPGGEYMPMEEIVDHGWGVALFHYRDVTDDRDDGFSSGLAGMFDRAGNGSDWGKIGMWAWAASRVLDYLLTLGEVDAGRVVAVGHSRLGKTALWCAAQDGRFAAAVSNNSGSSGAALSRGKAGETVADITRGFPYWFCDNYRRFCGREQEMPIDQHALLALIAPRPVYVASAEQDGWADPKSEFLSCAAAGAAYELLGRSGLVHGGCWPEPGCCLHGGSIGYHLRPGTHFLSRADWQSFLPFLDARLPYHQSS